MEVTIKCECGNEEKQTLINSKDELDKYKKFEIIATVGSSPTLYRV